MAGENEGNVEQRICRRNCRFVARNRLKNESEGRKTRFLPHKITTFFTTFVLFWRICLILAAKESIFLLEPRIFILKKVMSSANPLVSVVVPNYNYADYLAPRIDSILRQSFSDFELLLLDDCSTDHSVSVMKSSYL